MSAVQTRPAVDVDELVEVAAFAVTEALSYIKVDGLDWKELLERLDYVVEAAYNASNVWFDIAGDPSDPTMTQSETIALLEPIVAEYRNHAAQMATDDPQISGMGAASIAWWAGQEAKAARVMAAQGWGVAA